jgi:hypothetical protein
VVHVSRLAMIAVVGGLVVAPIVPVVRVADAGPKAGRIVRIERPRTGSSGVPRLCRLNDATSAICWARPPTRGEIGWVVGPDARGPGNRGQIAVGEVTEVGGSCSSPTYWEFKIEPMDANLKDVDSWATWVLFDLDLGSGAKSVEPSVVKDPPDDQNSPWVAVDRGRGDAGDGGADFVVTAYSCDEHGSPNPSTANGYCIDYWYRPANRWSLLRRDVAVPASTCRP